MDPPWPEHGGGQIKRGADRHYTLMKPSNMPAVIRGSGLWLPATNAHLYCWVTDNYLPDGLKLVEELGFRYVRTIQWVKTTQDGTGLRAGLGRYARGAHEMMLFAVRGNGTESDVCTDRRDLLSVIQAPHPLKEAGKRVHSSKPSDAYAWIEARTHGPRVEFFARSNRAGWVSFGDDPNLNRGE